MRGGISLALNRRMRDGRAMRGVQKGIHYFCLLWPPTGSGKDGNRGLRGEGQQVNIIQAHLINKKKRKEARGKGCGQQVPRCNSNGEEQMS